MPVTINGTTGIAGVDGSASTPAVQGSDTNTGEFFPAADTIAWTTGGSERMRVDSSGNVGIGTNSPVQKLQIVNGNIYFSTTNYVMWDTNGNYGIQSDGSSRLSFFSGSGSERARIDSSGNLLVGTTSADARLQIQSAGTTSATRAFRAINSASTELCAILSSGEFYTGTAGNSPYNSTTGSGANVFVASTGQLQRSTSSLKYKTDVKDATHGLTEVLQLRPVTYKGKNDGDTVFGGLIAEEVDAVGLTEFVQYAEDGSPDALAYGNMVSLLVKAIQELKAELDALKGAK